MTETSQRECEREDCQQIAAAASDVYCAITGGLLSYPNYDAQTILSAYGDDVTTQIDEAVAAARIETRAAVLAGVVAELTKSEQLRAAAFVGRMAEETAK